MTVTRMCVSRPHLSRAFVVRTQLNNDLQNVTKMSPSGKIESAEFRVIIYLSLSAYFQSRESSKQLINCISSTEGIPPVRRSRSGALSGLLLRRKKRHVKQLVDQSACVV
jgi:hypothetical protein